jgi:DNA repair protein RadC
MRKVAGYRLVRETPLWDTPFDRLPRLPRPSDVAAFLGPLAEREPVEVFWVLPLNTQHRLISGRALVVTRGTVSSTLVHPREVFRQLILLNAAAVIVAHNHPSGDPTPSADDRLVTEQLVAAGRLLGIPVLDHLVLGYPAYTSFAEAGLL